MAAQPTAVVTRRRATHHRGQHRRKPGPAYSEAARLLWSKLDELKLSTAEAAELAGVSTVTLLRWLHGDRRAHTAGSVACKNQFGIDPELWLVKPKGRHALLLPLAKAAA